jgi:ADP-ribose pyrophosphatase YjhB (NUDIX family)/inorganic pyrophosphatase
MLDGLILPDPGRPAYCARCATPLVVADRGGRARPICPFCGWVYYARPALGAAVAVELDGKLVLVQRAHEPYRGWWMLPAGFVEYGEFAEDTAVREAEEETGLLVALDGLFGLYHGAGDPRNVSHLAVYRARALGGTMRAADDAQDVRAFAPEDIPLEIAFESQRQVIADWAAAHHPAPAALRVRRLLRYDEAGPAAPVLVYAIVENPRGSTTRIRYDAVTGQFRPESRPFPWPLPAHYGFIPATRCAADGEPLDILIADAGHTAPGGVLVARPIGALYRADGDHKAVALRADGGTAHPEIAQLAELPAVQDEVARWHRAFRPDVPIHGWGDAAAARQLILDAQAAWATGGHA